MVAESYKYKRVVAAGILTAIGTIASGCSTTEYKTVKVCDTVDDRLTTTGSKVDAGRFLFGDGNIAQVPDDKYLIHTQKFGTVDVESDEYMDYPVGSQYCEEHTEEVTAAQE